MDQQQVITQLQDLPQTFTRPDQTWAQWVDSITTALTWFTQSVDALQTQFNFNQASNGWIDVWGTLVGVPRRANESNSVYQTRIQQTIFAWRDSVIAITNWIQLIENVSVTVTENLPSVGYAIVFPPSITPAQISAILANLVYVRPAGVPFFAYYSFGNVYLNTINYMGATPALLPAIGRVTGAYLAASPQPVVHSVPSGTDNALSLLPSLMFTDPTLNPSVG